VGQSIRRFQKWGLKAALLLLLSDLFNKRPTLETKERGTIDMALENGTYVNSLVTSNPASTDGIAQADDHIRLIKSTIKNTFPNLTGAVTVTQADLNNTTSIPSSLTDLGITDGSANQVLQTDGSGNFSFFTLPAGTTDTNYYVNGGYISGTTLTLSRQGLGNVSISGLPASVTNTSQLTNDSGFITAANVSVPDTLGVNQSYSSVTLSPNTWYHNTTGRAIALYYMLNLGGGTAYISTVGSFVDAIQVGGPDGDSGTWDNGYFIVPNGHYHLTNGSSYRNAAYLS